MMFCGKKKAEENSKEIPLNDRKIRIIKDEAIEEKSVIGINGGQ